MLTGSLAVTKSVGTMKSGFLLFALMIAACLMVRLVSSLFCLHLYFIDCPSLPYTISCNLNPISDLFMLLWLFDMHSRVRLPVYAVQLVLATLERILP